MGRKQGKTSRYWGVSRMSPMGQKSEIQSIEKSPWIISIQTPSGKRVYKSFATEREAAIHADRINLEHRMGKPLNILKPKP